MQRSTEIKYNWKEWNISCMKKIIESCFFSGFFLIIIIYSILYFPLLYLNSLTSYSQRVLGWKKAAI